MSAESNAGQPLQFDTAKPADPPDAGGLAHGVTCDVCGQAVDDEYYDINGQSACNHCRQTLAHHAETPKGFGVFAKAGLYGFGAAIAGAVLYYAVIAITNFEIGIVAIAIGYMVGYAVKSALGARGGRRFQILAIVLTYWAVGLAYVPLAFNQMREHPKQESPAAPSGSTLATPGGTSEPSRGAAGASNEPAGVGGLMVGIAALLFLSLALPVLIVAGSLPGGLISAAIIAFGMQKAWNMTGVPPLVISGPYRIAPSAAS